MLKELHDYVKKNYEQGNYKDAEAQYKNWDNRNYYDKKTQTQSKQSDYQKGYEQATQDFKNNRAFHRYPKEAVKIGNEITNNKLSEVSNFIAGYEKAKADLVNK
ncbi:hypothetical protein [Lentilactobacillus diolivorans]|uniref:Uncharacterized protein n=2 Tax=Lentilactobacillus diolivorans TaxID=179838 RepID=A0A0R1SBB4_9LACO|nr:hypothetical protein [Lentilactobacillus diolivorans]KRL66525.1 hypothetical protein FC85_GL002832 [Lentilactobacillus diolivorans DSM 14421]GEP23320.1 hypothetical protein LDI01_09130 [Lentilactobacillus diolivorans]